jgi:hypothetical protein
LLLPPRPLASPPGQYRRNLLPNMAHGLTTSHITQPEYQKIFSKPWILLCSSYNLQHTSSNCK